jgi:hypothetical protein
MKRLTLGAVAGTILIVAVALSSNQAPTTVNGLQVQIEERNPWTNLRLNNAADVFHFAVVSDRTGGHRARIFSQAIDQLNLLQPAFVISVGDLIEGYTKEAGKLSSEWKEFQSYACKLQMPFFYVPGNHDVSNDFQEKDWQERFGRRYYHFIYRDVLFLMLCSDDPAPGGDIGGIGKDQQAFIEKTLKENAGVRWTIVALHRPLWDHRAAENGWLDVEKLLQGRPYTVFAGHIHRFKKFIRQGMNYYQLATTGGASRLRGVKYGEFDHITWVTMKKDGPLLANLMLDGIYTENMKQPITAEEGVVQNRKRVYPVRGKVFYEGTPTPEAEVVFHLIQGKKTRRVADGVADGIVEADGSFRLTTYHAFDGAPAGNYAVTVVWREPGANGRAGANRLPEKYAKAGTSGLRVEVKGTTDVVLNLTP